MHDVHDFEKQAVFNGERGAKVSMFGNSDEVRKSMRQLDKADRALEKEKLERIKKEAQAKRMNTLSSAQPKKSQSVGFGGPGRTDTPGVGRKNTGTSTTKRNKFGGTRMSTVEISEDL